MKQLICLLVIFTTVSLSARKRLTYNIKSDKKSSKVEAGNCEVYGIVTDYSGEPIAGALVSTLDHVTSTKTDEDGKFKFTISDKDSSIYMFKMNYDEVVIYNYDFKSQHKVEIAFYTYYREEIDEVEKPVIYLYNKKEIQTNIELKPKGKLSFTYPQYKDSWNVTVSSEGIKHNNKIYPYLFWEAEQNDMNFIQNNTELEGYAIKTDTATSFLENRVRQLGLNEIEATDFITYWGPRMVQKDYALVQFLVDDDYTTHIADIELSPKPKTSRRIFMLFYGSETDYDFNKIDLKRPSIKEFKRKGFTLIEWGGTELHQLEINI